MGRTAADGPVADTGTDDEAPATPTEPATPDAPAPDVQVDDAPVEGNERELVTVYHEGLDRHDRVPRGAAHSMIKSGWETVDDLPVDDQGLPVDLPVDAVVTIAHPELVDAAGDPRTQSLTIGAARALVKNGWVPVALVDTTSDGSQPAPPLDPDHPPAVPAATTPTTED